MSNILDADGLTLQTKDQLTTQLETSFQAIFGADVDLSSSSPDGQLIGVEVQAILDIEDITAQTFSSFDVTQAVGTQLDQRVAINGIQRQAGSYTTCLINITVSQSLTLFGLDQTAQPIYTVQDNAGNQWQLVTTANISTTGVPISYVFQSAVIGAVNVIPNTITSPKSIILGVTTINNPSSYLILGTNEETDAALRIRQQQSTQLPSQGYFAGLYAALGNITGVTSRFLYENFTNVNPDANGVPAHCLWVIVAGSFNPADVARAIYVERTSGCNMKGAQTYTIPQVDGSFFTVQWDDVVEETIFAQFTATSIDGIHPPNIQQIIEQLPELFVPTVGSEVNTNQLIAAVITIDPNCLVTNAGLSTSSMGPFVSQLFPTAKNYQFTLATANIVVTPIIVLPQGATISRLSTQLFTAYGGTQSFTYSISVNNSGGSIDGTTGLYTAGSSIGNDTILATDTGSNTATSIVKVV